MYRPSLHRGGEAGGLYIAWSRYYFEDLGAEHSAGAFDPMDRIVSEGDIAKLQQFVGRVVVSRVNLGTLGVVLIVLFKVKQSSSMD